MGTMPIEEIIEQVKTICKKNHVSKLMLIGSFAKGTNTKYSDVDFAVWECRDILQLEQDLENIQTLRKIDIFEYESIHNAYLLEDIEKYGKQIY